MRLSEELLCSNVLAKRIPEADSSDLSGVRADGAAPLFCSASCAANAENFFMIESRGDWSELHHYCTFVPRDDVRIQPFLIPL